MEIFKNIRLNRQATVPASSDAAPKVRSAEQIAENARLRAMADAMMLDLQVEQALDATPLSTGAQNKLDLILGKGGTQDSTPTKKDTDVTDSVSSTTRRGTKIALGLTGLTVLAGFAAACTPSSNADNGSDTGTGVRAGKSADTDVVKTPESKKTIEWPTSAKEAAKQMGLSAADAKYIVKGQNGVWNAEFFPLNTGVTFENGVHKLDGKVITDPNAIFDFSADPVWTTVTNNSQSGTLFARTGGAGPDGDKNVSRFMGPKGEANNIEQAALIPAPEDCVNDPHTASWRNAAVEFVYNQDAQKNVITVGWYNPTSKELEVIDGKTIASYAKTMSEADKNAFADVLRTLPMNYPLTPEQAVAVSGGKTKPENWTLDISTGTWKFEGFNLAKGVSYDKVGGVLRQGSSIVGVDTGYNYTDWKSAKANLWATQWTFPTLDGVYGFVRTGGGSDFKPNTSYYGVGGTVETSGKRGFEQGSIIPVKPRTDCTAEKALTSAVAKAAQHQVSIPDVEEVFIVTEGGSTQVK